MGRVMEPDSISQGSRTPPQGDHCEAMRLSDADSDVFVQAMIDPPEPNEALSRAFQQYRDSVEN
jgi:hypothetical protein